MSSRSRFDFVKKSCAHTLNENPSQSPLAIPAGSVLIWPGKLFPLPRFHPRHQHDMTSLTPAHIFTVAGSYAFLVWPICISFLFFLGDSEKKRVATTL
jgi:hypothetical protein